MNVAIERRTDGYLLRTVQWVPHPVERVFDFFADAGTLQVLTPAFLHFEIVTPLPIEMRAGALIDYKLRVRGVPIRWRTEIAEWEPPGRFVDRMVHGPYTEWIHEHRFEEHEGGTRMTDEVRYGVPGGAIAHWLFVRRDLERIFAYRAEQLKALRL